MSHTVTYDSGRIERHGDDGWITTVAVEGGYPPMPAYDPRMDPFTQRTAYRSEWRKPNRPYAECDTECYPDYWLFKVWLPDDRMYSIKMEEGHPLNIEAIQWFIDNFTLVTFNGDNYDIPMISLAMAGADNYTLKRANDNIIVGGLKRWDFYKAYGCEQPRNLDHVDVMEVAPGVKVGLKTYMGRMHSKKLQDLPYKPDQLTTPSMRNDIDVYCGNDLDGTRGLRLTVAQRIELREVMGQQYGIDLRSKSDAQMAEAIIKAKLGFIPEKRIVPHGWSFRYTPPPYIKFNSHKLQEALRIICEADFIVNDVDQIKSYASEKLYDEQGKEIKTGIVMPLELKDLVISIGDSKYKLGLGGLHSQEQSVSYHTTDRHKVVLSDVRSYYPSLILNLGITPTQLGPRFQEVFREIYDTRLDAKDKVSKGIVIAVIDGVEISLVITADGLKIVLNGTFGKLANKYSIMYAPELLIMVTLTGQLCLLMLIESLENHGINVVSANTDGIVTRCPVEREYFRDGCINHWSQTTGLEMENELVKSLYCRDVNSYVMVKPNGKHKGKGAFADSGVLNNVHPSQDIVTDAVIAYLKNGTPLAQTITECRDIRQFLIIRAVRGGGVYNTHGYTDAVGADEPTYLGKTVRWYYAANETRAIHYATSGNKVAGSTGARPMMELSDTFPNDVDYARYHAEAVKMLLTLGLQYPT